MRYVLCLGFTLFVTVPGAAQAPDWRADWEVVDGFRLAIDTEGYDLPTAIAFVPEPGNRPNDPLYFVTELRGRVRVVTNDRTVHTFAEGFTSVRPPIELPAAEGEHGVAGICLAPEQGYVFVTFVYQDSAGELRNNILRLDTEPRTFSVRPRAQRSFTEIFAADRSVNSHQIGACQVRDGLLYVSVADGLRPAVSQFVNSTQGKILRMTLDGAPVPGNPFYSDDGARTASDYVWAMGFRNPFGLEAVGDRLFVTENGPSIDRFLEVEEGGNYLWDGREWSIGTNAAVFSPPVGPVHVEYHPHGSNVFPPEYRDHFYMATAGRSDQAGPAASEAKSVLMLDYDFAARRMRSVPRQFLRFRGSGLQIVSGVAFGPDGLYVVPILPGATGRSAILKVIHDPESVHPFVIGRNLGAAELIGRYGCRGCHVIGELGGTAGPSLTSADLVARLTTRLGSAGYLRALAEVDTLDRDPFRQYAKARREVAAAEGVDRVRAWVTYRIMEPRFDAPTSLMPSLGISEGEAALIANYLIESQTAPAQGVAHRLMTAVRTRIPTSRHRYSLLAFLAGALMAVGAARVSKRIRARKA